MKKGIFGWWSNEDQRQKSRWSKQHFNLHPKGTAAAFPLVLFKVVSLDLLRSQEEKRKACSIWVLLSIMNWRGNSIRVAPYFCFINSTFQSSVSLDSIFGNQAAIANSPISPISVPMNFRELFDIFLALLSSTQLISTDQSKSLVCLISNIGINFFILLTRQLISNVNLILALILNQIEVFSQHWIFVWPL